MSNTAVIRNKRWIAPPSVDPAVVQDLEVRSKGFLPPIICRLLAQRGITDIAAAKAFLQPQLETLHDPFLMKDVRTVVDRLLAAKERGDTVGIHGDYDVDGLTSTTLYTLVLRKLGFQVVPFVPHRMIDGYGVSVRALQDFVARGVRVVLTCDTGTSAVEEVRRAVDDFGLEVLVTDHHHVPPTLPKAHALVNPHQAGCAYPFKDLCGAGVAFKVLQALIREMGLDEQELLYPHLDLVALGTVADVVPLVGENRVLVKHGIRHARDSQNLGLRTLFEVAQTPLGQTTEGTFGWIIAPRLNAVGRIDDAGKGLQLLTADDPSAALALAKEIDYLNTERQKLNKAIEANAYAEVDAWDLEEVYGIALFGEMPAGDDAAGALADPGVPATPVAAGAVPAGEDSDDVEWHHGVIGIVAGRVVERYGRPAFLFAFDPASQKWKGSGRAPNIEKVNLVAALDACAEHLHKYGGHAWAAGATLKAKTREELEAFRRAFDAAVRQQMDPEDRVPQLKADLEVRLDDLTWGLYRLIQRFAPFDREANRAVNMIARQVTVKRVIPLGKNPDTTHLKLFVEQNGVAFECVAWQFRSRFPELCTTLKGGFQADIFFKLKENVWNGEMTLQLELADIRLPEPPPTLGLEPAAVAPAAGREAYLDADPFAGGRARIPVRAGVARDAVARLQTGGPAEPTPPSVPTPAPTPAVPTSGAPARRRGARAAEAPVDRSSPLHPRNLFA